MSAVQVRRREVQVLVRVRGLLPVRYSMRIVAENQVPGMLQSSRDEEGKVRVF